MKKYAYFVLIESFLFLIIAGCTIANICINKSIIWAVFCSVLVYYCVWESIKGVRLIIDILLKKCYTVDTVLMGILNTGSLEAFPKVNYANIYFDDDTLTKNYMLFDDNLENILKELRPDDKVRITYYKYSRIIIKLIKL